MEAHADSAARIGPIVGGGESARGGGGDQGAGDVARADAEEAGALAVDVENAQLLYAFTQQRVGHRRSCATGAHLDHALTRSVLQATAKTFGKTQAIGVVADALAVLEHHRIHRADAARRIAAYAGDKTLTVALPEGPGSDLLLREIAADWREVGVNAVRARAGQAADLELIDTLARFGNRRWYLNQFACAVRRVLCDPKADELVRAARGGDA